jgi:hypothetical protein
MNCSRSLASRAQCCRNCAPRPMRACTVTAMRWVRWAGACQSAVIWGTSKPRSLVRSRSRRAKPKTPTAPVAFCYSTPAKRSSRRNPVCSRQLPRQWATTLQRASARQRSAVVRRRSSSRSKVRLRLPARRCNGCAIISKSSRTRRRRNRLRNRLQTPAACTLCRRSTACSRRTGICTRAARSLASRVTPRVNTSSARRSRRFATRRARSSRRWSKIRGCHSNRSRWTVAR